jgi:hypothetical protein
MKIEIVSFDEDARTAELDVDAAGRQYLLELGFNALIMKALEGLEDEREKNQSV